MSAISFNVSKASGALFVRKSTRPVRVDRLPAFVSMSCCRVASALVLAAVSSEMLCELAAMAALLAAIADSLSDLSCASACLRSTISR